jgi:hypothetical protein
MTLTIWRVLEAKLMHGRIGRCGTSYEVTRRFQTFTVKSTAASVRVVPRVTHFWNFFVVDTQ